MEACSGAHHWARLFQASGHTVRLIAPKFVTPYRMAGFDLAGTLWLAVTLAAYALAMTRHLGLLAVAALGLLLFLRAEARAASPLVRLERLRDPALSGSLAMSEFTLNNQAQPWREGLSIAALLAEQGRATDAVATALNGAFLPRARREATLIQPGDELTLIQPITGG